MKNSKKLTMLENRARVSELASAISDTLDECLSDSEAAIYDAIAGIVVEGDEQILMKDLRRAVQAKLIRSIPRLRAATINATLAAIENNRVD